MFALPFVTRSGGIAVRPRPLPEGYPMHDKTFTFYLSAPARTCYSGVCELTNMHTAALRREAAEGDSCGCVGLRGGKGCGLVMFSDRTDRARDFPDLS